MSHLYHLSLLKLAQLSMVSFPVVALVCLSVQFSLILALMMNTVTGTESYTQATAGGEDGVVELREGTLEILFFKQPFEGSEGRVTANFKGRISGGILFHTEGAAYLKPRWPATVETEDSLSQ